VDGHALKIDSNGFSSLDRGAGSFTVTFVPEPSTTVLIAIGLPALFTVRRRMRSERIQVTGKSLEDLVGAAGLEPATLSLEG
jgi:hypothetical protein